MVTPPLSPRPFSAIFPFSMRLRRILFYPFSGSFTAFFFLPYRFLSVLTYSSLAIPFSYAYFTLLTTTGQSLFFFSLGSLDHALPHLYYLTNTRFPPNNPPPFFLHTVVARNGFYSLYCLIPDIMSYDATCTQDHEKSSPLSTLASRGTSWICQKKYIL